MLRAALAGCGLAYVPQDMVRALVDDGRLVQVLEDWCQSFPGYYLYYPSRRQASAALTLVVEAMVRRLLLGGKASLSALI
jgi:DNA-binding transcriptional LysR family regulator